MLFFHEISHILAFNDNLFPYFIGIKNPITKAIINGVERTLLKTPKVLEYARGHFGCPSLGGVELENQGGSGSAGSHWEGRIMFGDYMISIDYSEIVVSDITLAVFEDSGWYSVNYFTGGLFKTGKAEGCEFLQNTCIDRNTQKARFSLDFCDDNSFGYCTPGHLIKGYCYLVSFSSVPEEYQYFNDKTKLGGYESFDYCPISINSDIKDRCDEFGNAATNETVGNKSFCFETFLFEYKPFDFYNINSIYPKCFEVKECNYNTLSYTIGISSENNFICPNAVYRKEYKVENSSGSITCPPFWRICGGTKICNNPYDCAINSVSTLLLNTNDYILNKTVYNPVYTYKEKNEFNFICYKTWMMIFIFFIMF